MIRALLPLLASGALLSKPIADAADPVAREAICLLHSEPNETGKGIVTFKQA